MAVPAAPSRLPLLWYSALADPGGYADEARAYLVALERCGYEAAARELRWTDAVTELPPAHRAAVEAALARPVPDDPHVSVFHLVAQPVPAATNGPRVCRTMFECASIPRHWPAALWDYDEIWVPTQFNLESFRHGGLPESRLRVLPETIDFDLFDPAAATPLELDGPPRFRFLSNFDFTDRKGWDLLLDAWADAFAPDDEVELVLKLTALHVPGREIERRIAARLGSRRTAPIRVLERVFPVADMPRLYAACDAYVSPSRGEGWGRPYMEAMAMGLPTIGSRWSGNLAFMHDRNSWLLDGRVVPVPAAVCAHTSVYRGQSWFDPDREALVAALREVRRGGDAVTARAAAARPELLERFGAEATAARIAGLVESALGDARARASRPPACVWRGGWGSGHSLAVVNDALVAAVEQDGAPVRRLRPDSPAEESGAVGVAHQWPPLFEAPSDGPFVLYQPWEFGEIPAAWAERIRRGVDEVWTASEYSRRAFLAAGIASDLVHVVPNGVDLDRFHPDGPRAALPTTKKTVLLFVGGTIHRKGIDVLLEAYGAAFTAADDVALVVKGFGGASYYAGQTAEALFDAFRARPGAPELVTLDDELPFEEMAALYRAADVVVQPYRGEGFCLPALEALACGVPVIVTAGGPTDDFTSDACAWRIPSTRVPLAAGALAAEGLAPAGRGFLLEPDVDALAAALRDAVDPAARAARASEARPHAERFGWRRAAERVRERLDALAARTPIRRSAAAEVPGRRGTLFLAPADWDAPETWADALRAYVQAFSPEDDVTLVLPGTADGGALALVASELERAGVDPAAAPDIALADPGPLGPHSLELAADAVICADDRTWRSRLVVPPDPKALRALVPIAEEAA